MTDKTARLFHDRTGRLRQTNEQIDAYIDRVYAGAPGSYSDHFGYTITKDARRSAAYLESLGYSFDLPAE